MVIGSAVGHVPSGVIGYNSDVVAHLVLVRVTKEWIERLTHCHIW